MLARKRKNDQGEAGNVKVNPSRGVTIAKRHRNLEQKPNMGSEELYPVTVETSVCDESGATLIRHSQINMLSFCVFCLRKTTDVQQSNVASPPLSRNQEDVTSSELLEDVPGAGFLGSFSSQLLSTFNRIWAYLGMRKEDVELNEDPLLHVLEELRTVSTNNKGHTVFLDLPRMCVPCAVNLQTVHRLFTELSAQMDGIERIIKDSKYFGKYSWRAEHFENYLTTSNLEKGVIAATLDIFLEKLGRNGHKAAENNLTVNAESACSIAAESEALAYLPTSFQNNQPASQLFQGANFLPDFQPVTQVQPKRFGDSIGVSDVLHVAKRTQPVSASSSYVQVAPAGDSFGGGDFVDEDDDWNGNESDPDYIKSEPEDDFSEEDEESSGEDQDFADEWTLPTKTRRKDQVCASGTRVKPRKYRKRAARQQLEESGQVLVTKDPETGNEKFSCKIDGCNRSYNRWITFRVHQKEMHSAEACASRIKSHRIYGRGGKRKHQEDNGQLLVEKNSKTGKQNFHCRIDGCDKTYFSMEAFRLHEKNKHLVDTRIMCDLCLKKVALKDMRAHVREHVGDEYLIPCPNPTCQHAFSKAPSLYRHLTQTSKHCGSSVSNLEQVLEMANSLKCQECEHKASKRADLRRHLLSMHENPTKNFSCPIDGCSQQFTVKQSVHCHIMTHKEPQSTQVCFKCKQSVTLEEMEKHLKEAHGVKAEEVVKCSHCSFVFPTRKRLVDHLFEHRNSPLSCDICGDQVNFSRHLDLREHYGNVHNVGKRFPCTHCEYVAWTGGALELHIGTKHESHHCDQCDKSFARIGNLRNHKEMVHAGKLKSMPQVCDLCKKRIAVKDMRAHAREHVGDEYLIPCPNPVCPYTYLQPRSLLVHLRNSKRCCESISNIEQVLKMAKNTKCQECEYLAKKSIGLRHHLLREHETSTKNFSCPIENCLQEFTVKQSVQFHIVTHKARREPEPLSTQTCAECNCVFKFEEMEKHLEETHGIVAEEVVKCAHCPFVFPTREHLLEHLFEHRSSVLSCDICGDQVKFTRHVRLREHYFISHNIGKRFSCELCSSVCYTQSAWKEHMANKHKQEKKANDDIVINVPEKQTIPKKGYKCDSCDAAYSCSADLKDHKIKEHGAEPYRCKICTATFLARNHLLKHEKEHGSIKFTCEVEGCGKSYDLNCNLKNHMSTAHRGEKPHVCELCGKSYAQAQGLKMHNDAVHLGLRSYVCDTCGESFTSGTVLRRHKLIHTGERPFSCDICGQRFRHKEVLMRHVEGHRKKGADFKPNGPMKQVRKRVELKGSISV